MATPPPRHSTPPGGSQAPRSTKKAGRSSSHAPAVADEFLSPVSKFNRTKEQLKKEQEERMKALPGDRMGRLARLSAPAGASSAKRKLTELEAAAAATVVTTTESKGLNKVKKSRTSSPTRRSQQAKATASTSKRAVSDAHMHHSSTLSASALKRHDERHGRKTQSDVHDRVTADTEQRYLAYAHAQKRMSVHSTPPQSQRSSTGGAQGLFSRHADPSVLKTPPESTTSSPFKFPGYESSEPSTQGSPLPIIRTPPRGDGALPIQLTPRGDDGMVDLERVSTVAGLETVEGDDILSTLMTMTTPRVGRHFPSEHTRTDSEEREIQFLRRRRLAAARRSIDTRRPLVTDDVVNNKSAPRAKWDFEGELEPVSTPSMRRRVASKDAQQARDDAENAKAQIAENDDALDEDEDDDDDETTETKVARFSQAKQWSLRRFVLWLVVGAGFLCILDVALPLVLSLFEPPKPFCDGNTSMLGEMGGEQTALTLIDNSQFTALQPYREECRACPLFGVCSNGALVSCLPPLEERNGACVESKEVQYALEQIAKSIEKHVMQKATVQVCGSTPQLPSLWGDDASTQWDFEELSHVVVLLSELKEVVLSSPFAETLMNISLAAATGNAAAEYVFNRSLDLALSGFQTIAQVGFEKMSQYVGSGAVDTQRADMAIQFSTAIAPWRCRARNQLITHVHLIAIVVAAFALVTLLYRRWLVYKTKRALVDRLVKEVRYFLLGRSHRTERFYPANHLRDNLFDTLPNVSPGDRKWLRESVWPTVASIVAEDSRVHCHIAPIHGKQMVVWEWISSNSPNKKTDEQKKRVRARNARKRYSI